MWQTFKEELNSEWHVVKPVLAKNFLLKVALVLLVSFIHNTDGQARKYNSLMNAIYNPTHDVFASGVMALAEWDGLYFLQATLVGYTNLKQFAFFPGFPTLMRFLLGCVHAVPGASLVLKGIPIAVVAVFTGFCVNLVLHLANNWLLYQWLRRKGCSQHQAEFAILTFGLGGNTLYHVAYYSESLYMFITLLSLYLITKVGKNPADLPLSQFIFLVVLFSCSGFVRYIGVTNGAYLGYPLLLEFIYCLVKEHNRHKALQIFKRIVIVVLCFFTPIIFLFIKSRMYFCHGPTEDDPDYKAPGFCGSAIGFYYSSIQEAYWGLKPFYYLRNPYDLLGWSSALVTFMVSTIWLYKAHRNAGTEGFLKLHIPEFLTNHNLQSPRIVEMPDLVIFSLQYVSYYAYAHLGSVERFWSATPSYYLFLASVQQLLVRLSQRKSGEPEPEYYMKILKYVVPASLTIRQFLVPVWHSLRIYPI